MSETLQDLRSKAAEWLWQEHNFDSYRVEDAYGWESMRDTMSRVIYIESDSHDEPTERGRFHVEFEPGSQLIQSCRAFLSKNGEDIGQGESISVLNERIRELTAGRKPEEFNSALNGPAVRFVVDTEPSSETAQSPSPSYAIFDVHPQVIDLILKSQAFCNGAKTLHPGVHVSIPAAALAWGPATEGAEDLGDGRISDNTAVISSESLQFNAWDANAGSRIATKAVQIEDLIADYMAAKAQYNTEVILCKADGPGLAHYEAMLAESAKTRSGMAQRG